MAEGGGHCRYMPPEYPKIRSKDLIDLAKNGQWMDVFQALGCKLTLVDDEPPTGGQGQSSSPQGQAQAMSRLGLGASPSREEASSPTSQASPSPRSPASSPSPRGQGQSVSPQKTSTKKSGKKSKPTTPKKDYRQERYLRRVLAALRADTYSDDFTLFKTEEAKRDRPQPTITTVKNVKLPRQLHHKQIVDWNVFPSLRTEWVRPTAALMQKDEEKVVQQALANDEEWDTLTIVLFMLCGCGLHNKKIREALHRAARRRHWKYFFLICVDYLHLYFYDSIKVLSCFNLDVNVLRDPVNRLGVISEFIDDNRWAGEVWEVIIKTLYSWCFISPEPDCWNLVMKVSQDFAHVTSDMEGVLTASAVLCYMHDKRMGTDCLRTLLDLALQYDDYAVVKVFGRILFPPHYIRPKDCFLAFNMALARDDWDTFLFYLDELPASELTEFIMKEDTPLHKALQLKDYFLNDRQLPKDLNVKDRLKGHTPLHRALQCWRRTSTDLVTHNIIVLLRHGADPTIPFPGGKTVLEFVADDNVPAEDSEAGGADAADEDQMKDGVDRVKNCRNMVKEKYQRLVREEELRRERLQGKSPEKERDEDEDEDEELKEKKKEVKRCMILSGIVQSTLLHGWEITDWSVVTKHKEKVMLVLDYEEDEEAKAIVAAWKPPAP